MKEIKPEELNFNALTEFSFTWGIVVTKANEKDNGMTIGWGQIGTLWGKPVMSVYIRNTRATFPMLNESEEFSVCFLEETDHHNGMLFGRKSGRDMDKITASGLTRAEDHGVLYLKESKVIFILKKIYEIDLPIDGVVQDPSILKYYNPGEYHRQYIGEIVRILVQD